MRLHATDPVNKELVDQFGVTSAPTLVVIKDGKTSIAVGAGPIIGLLKN